MRSDSVKNMSAYADQNHAPSLTDVRLEWINRTKCRNQGIRIHLSYPQKRRKVSSLISHDPMGKQILRITAGTDICDLKLFFLNPRL